MRSTMMAWLNVFRGFPSIAVGLVIAALFTPLFATAMMVHVHKALHHRDLRNNQA